MLSQYEVINFGKLINALIKPLKEKESSRTEPYSFIQKMSEAKLFDKNLRLIDSKDLTLCVNAISDEIKSRGDNCPSEIQYLLYNVLDGINGCYNKKITTSSKYRTKKRSNYSEAKTNENIKDDDFINKAIAEETPIAQTIRASNEAILKYKELLSSNPTSPELPEYKKRADELEAKALNDKLNSMSAIEKAIFLAGLNAAATPSYTVTEYDENAQRKQPSIFAIQSSGDTNIPGEVKQDVGKTTLHIWAWVIKDLFRSQRDILNEPFSSEENIAICSYLTEMLCLGEDTDTQNKRRQEFQWKPYRGEYQNAEGKPTRMTPQFLLTFSDPIINAEDSARLTRYGEKLIELCKPMNARETVKKLLDANVRPPFGMMEKYINGHSTSAATPISRMAPTKETVHASSSTITEQKKSTAATIHTIIRKSPPIALPSTVTLQQTNTPVELKSTSSNTPAGTSSSNNTPHTTASEPAITRPLEDQLIAPANTPSKQSLFRNGMNINLEKNKHAKGYRANKNAATPKSTS